ncbi:hypothetical protein BDZ45DRAFT_740374 [Acephala macrosclerotiorum]|nr:hypothetical protein BDZ45DRAFT_740374 [Acephala macrosclerotiorum]
MWVMGGKDDMAKLRSSLEAHKSALEIAFDMATMTIAREIKADTQEIRIDTSAIKADTTQILAEIARLQLPPQDVNQNTSGFMLERYPDNLTTHAETVCDTVPDDLDMASIDYNGEEEISPRPFLCNQEVIQMVPDEIDTEEALTDDRQYSWSDFTMIEPS